MVVVYNADERFAEIFATSVLSLFENNKDMDEITVYLIENGITDESKAKIQNIAEKYGREIFTLPMPDIEKLAGVDIVIPSYNRMATCGRLFIASLLPKTIDKVIYADCDIIFVDSIRELWEMDISDYPIGMADGAMNAAYRELLDLPREGTYFNSGILLINLKRWREDEVEKKFLTFMASQGGYVSFPDEGTLNAVFDGNIFCLPLKYNVISMVYAFSHDEICKVKALKQFYTKEEVSSARKNPVVVHFTHNFYMPLRPWMIGCNHPYADAFLSYKAMTPWADKPLWTDNRSTISRIYTKFCHIIPKGIMIWISKIITVYMTPIWHRINKRKALRSISSRGGTSALVLWRQMPDIPLFPYVGGAAA